jgi:MoaA/NifB/PqqE/SkfB family radical SAM enzyme
VRIRSPVIGGIRAKLLRILLLLYILWIGVRVVGHPTAALRGLKVLQKNKRRVSGGSKLSKFVRAGNRYFAGLYIPAWPSLPFRRFIEGEYLNWKASRFSDRKLQSLIFGITTRCSLLCRHCFAGALINEPEPLSLDQLREILRRFQQTGVAQVQWSGGEPLERFADMISLTEGAQADTEFWVLTSGFGLTPARAKIMQRAGIRGVNISLDHWRPAEHNAFRGSDEAFSRVVSAVRIARECDLAVCLSLCATRQFVTQENLARYMQLSYELEVGFVQILEARAIGRFSGQDVSLSDEQFRLLDQFYYRLNGERSSRPMPVVTYHGYHQRRNGCYGGGDRFLYVDPRGDVYPCPFSSRRLGNVLNDTVLPGQARCEKGCDRFVLARARPEPR